MLFPGLCAEILFAPIRMFRGLPLVMRLHGEGRRGDPNAGFGFRQRPNIHVIRCIRGYLFLFPR
jgi:hypothetical protein